MYLIRRLITHSRYTVSSCNFDKGESHGSALSLIHISNEVTVIDPDKKLERVAKKRGWQIVDWDS